MPISTIGSNSLNQTSDLTINGQTVGKGGGNVATNTVHGASALSSNTSGAFNVAIGRNALTTNTTGSDNVAIGDGSQLGTTTGVKNVSAGSGTLYANTTGSYNVAMGAPEATNGYAALRFNTTGSNNTALGSGSLGSNTTATRNTAVGYQAGYALTTNNSSTIIGAYAGNATTGASNTFLGDGSGELVTSGANNTILGRHNGNQGGLDIRTASNNIVLSDGSGNPRLYCTSSGRWSMNGGTNTTNSVFHVYSTTNDPDIQMGSNTDGRDIHLYMVNSTRTSMFAQVSNVVAIVCGGSGGVQLSNGASSWSAYSDSRLKDVTGAYTNALADVVKLEPVKFTWKADEGKTPCVGLIAQSVEKVVPEAIDKTKKFDYKETGDETEYLSVRYTELIPLMVASIQELKTIVDAQAAEIAELKAKVA